MLRDSINAAISEMVGIGNFEKAVEFRKMLEEMEVDSPELLELDCGFAYDVRVIKEDSDEEV